MSERPCSITTRLMLSSRKDALKEAFNHCITPSRKTRQTSLLQEFSFRELLDGADEKACLHNSMQSSAHLVTPGICPVVHAYCERSHVGEERETGSVSGRGREERVKGKFPLCPTGVWL